MRNYMKALLERFDLPSERTSRLEKKVMNTHRQLTAKLPKPERKLLLRLTDLEEELRDEVCLNSFTCGFRLAQGIQQELNPPYSFENENKQKACEMTEKEVTL